MEKSILHHQLELSFEETLQLGAFPRVPPEKCYSSKSVLTRTRDKHQRPSGGIRVGGGDFPPEVVDAPTLESVHKISPLVCLRGLLFPLFVPGLGRLQRLAHENAPVPFHSEHVVPPDTHPNRMRSVVPVEQFPRNDSVRGQPLPIKRLDEEEVSALDFDRSHDSSLSLKGVKRIGHRPSVTKRKPPPNQSRKDGGEGVRRPRVDYRYNR